MAPVRLSHTWSRRVYVGVFLFSLGYVGLYGLQYAQVVSSDDLTAGSIPAIAAALALITSCIGFFAVKKLPTFTLTFTSYVLFAVATAAFILETGGTGSPAVALWALVAFCSAAFGVYGWLPAMVIVGVFTAGIYLNAEFTLENIVTIGLAGLVPVLAGMVLWRDSTNTEDPSEKNVKNLASQLSEVATKSEIVINAIGDGVIALDGKGIIQLINPAAQEILGWGKQDALMLSYNSILKLADENSVDLTPDADPIQQVLNTNQQTRGKKLIAITQSGKKINLSLVASPIGEPGSGAIAVFRDITNERAEEREQAEFISTASHEMRTPVASIEGYLGLALNPATAQIDQKARDFILKAHEAAQHLGRLFQDLLDVSKSEDGRMGNVPRVVDVVAYVQTIAQGLTQKAADKGLQLIFKPTESSDQKKIMPVYYVNQDNDHIREIVDNLIENAIKYTPSGSITVDINGSDDTVVISIQDTGLGIPPEDVSHLFQKFYRVNNMDRQSIGGTGLGLYLVRRLAEAMQGRVWVESEFGKGSTFFLELPRIDSQEATHLKEVQAAEIAQKTAAQPVAVPVAPVAQAISQPAIIPTYPQPQPSSPSVSINIIEAKPENLTAGLATLVPRDSPQLNPGVRPATTVPRGESLSREQIAERVRQLEALAKTQRTQSQGRE
jgi:two-component system, OmpR family, sensor histidine kinase VicK